MQNNSASRIDITANMRLFTLLGTPWEFVWYEMSMYINLL